MTLRRKTLLIICITFLGLVGALYALTQVIVMRGFEEEEEQATKLAIKRVSNSLEDEVDGLAAVTRDWSQWDDAYEYVQGRDSHFYKTNLAADTAYINNRLNIIVFLDKAGQVVSATAFDLNPENPRFVPVPADFYAHLKPGGPLLRLDPGQGGASGLLALRSGAMVVAAEPVLMSDGTGPALGTLVFGRSLSMVQQEMITTEVKRLDSNALLNLNILPANDPSLPTAVREGVANPGSDSAMPVEQLDTYTMAGYKVLADVYGEPALAIRVEVRAHVLERGRATVLYFMLALTIIGGVFGLVIMSLLEKQVLSRLRRLSVSVDNIAESRDTSARLAPAGGDELTGLAVDINRMLDALQQSRQQRLDLERRFQAVFESALDSMLVLDEGGWIVEANPAARTLLNLNERVPLVSNLQDYMPDEHTTDKLRDPSGPLRAGLSAGAEGPSGQENGSDEGVESDESGGSNEGDGSSSDGNGSGNRRREWSHVVEKGGGRGETRIMRLDGQVREVEYYSKANVIPGYHLVAIRDITERKLLEERLEYQAYHDTLTGLPNRALFKHRLTQVLDSSRRDATPVALLFLDLDDFKVINDSLGHRVGDQLLVTIGDRLSLCLRPGDMVARLGGDEFTVLVNNIASEEDAVSVARRIIEQVKRPFKLEGQQVFLSTSIGIALSDGGEVEPDELLRNADVAMYEAKKRGKSRYMVFESTMNVRAWKRLQTEIELRRALEVGEFAVYYQPVVRLATGNLVEVEALVRWEHPERGVIPPSEFIPVAEETGLIIGLGEWVLEQGCKQMRQWQRIYGVSAPKAMSVNLSVKQFREPRLLDEIGRILRETGLEPRCLKLEITESVALDDAESTIETLDALHGLGVQLSMDDFGTGYSALSYLKRYPMDSLKIDMSFIKGLGRNAEDTAIVHAMIAFAKTLRLNVTAEGIESVEQLQQLRALGCDWGQGYYFARPMPTGQIELLFGAGALGGTRTGKELAVKG